MKTFREFISEGKREKTGDNSRPEYVLYLDDKEYLKTFSDKEIKNRLKSKKFEKDSEGKTPKLIQFTPTGKTVTLNYENFGF